MYDSVYVLDLIMKDQDEELILIFPHKEDRDSFILDIQGVSKAFQ
jgi:hypothetical protein